MKSSFPLSHAEKKTKDENNKKMKANKKPKTLPSYFTSYCMLVSKELDES